jgi:hypothetical protein
MNYFISLIFIGVGTYAIIGATLDAQWFMGNPKAQVFVRLLGRLGTRIFYTLLGIGLIIMGFFGTFGFFD